MSANPYADPFQSDKLPPHSDEAELGVLGCIMLSPLEGLEHCAALNVQPDSFYDLRHRLIYEGLVRLCLGAKAIDLITLSNHLKERKELEHAGGLAYVAALPDSVPSFANIPHYIEILLEKAVARKTIALCTETVGRAYEKNSDAWLAEFREKVIELRIGCQVIAKTIGELVRPPTDDPTAFFQHRYLCECGSLLINGPTGMGKSSFALQAFALWSNCLPFFCIQPTRPLTAVLIQAENDEGDLAEMRDGICTGLNFDTEQRINFFNRVRVVTSNGTVGRRFCNEVIQPMLILHKPNLIGIDPANSFIGGDVKEQRDVGAFLRTWLNPLLFAHKAAAVVVHHTNKPPSGKEKPNWRNGELAYTGSGSAEWANWARAVLAIQDTGTHGIYRLHAPKRGIRLHWRNEGSDEALLEKLIGHAQDGLIYWRDANESEIEDATTQTRPAHELLQFLEPGALTTIQWFKTAHSELNVSRSTFFRQVKWLEANNRASKFDSKWRKYTPKSDPPHDTD